MMKQQIQRVQRGFTLIELMIVVAIIGILAAIAIPQYQDYLSRARWSDNLSQVAQVQTAIGECSQNNGGTLTGNCDAIATLITNGFLPTGYAINATPNLASATVTGTTAALVLTGTAPTNSCIVTITPSVTAQAVSWAYTNGGGCNRSKTGVGT